MEVPRPVAQLSRPDQADYSPTDVPVIAGEGFAPDSEVTITVTTPDGTVTTSTTTTDSEGQFTSTYQESLGGGEYSVTVTDGANTAATTFTDSCVELYNDIGTHVGSYATIGTALAAAGNDFTLEVLAATWVGSVFVDMSVNLLGANAGVSAGINPGPRGDESVISDSAFVIAADYVTIDGFLFDGGDALWDSCIVTLPGVSNLTIANNIFEGDVFEEDGAPDNAIILIGATDTTISYNDISGFTSGVFMGETRGTSIVQNTIHGNQFGVTMALAEGANIEQNLISGNNYGVLGMLCENASLISNSFLGNSVALDSWWNTGTEAHFNIFVNNSVGIWNHTLENHSINAENNWWGANDGPGDVGPGHGDPVIYDTDGVCCFGPAEVDYDPWLTIGVSANPECQVHFPDTANPGAVPADGVSTSDVTADMTWNSDGEDTSGDGHIPDGTPIVLTLVHSILGSTNTATVFTGGGKAHAYVSSLNFGHVAVTGQAPTGINPADPNFEQAQDDTCVLFYPPGTGTGGDAGVLELVINLEGNVGRYPVTSDGRLLVDVRITSPDGNVTYEITAGTLVLNFDGTPSYMNTDPDVVSILAGTPPPPPGYEIMTVYQFGPSGTTFFPEATVIITYAPDKLPEGAVAVIAYYDEETTEWMDMETAGYVAGGVEVANTVASRVSHFTYFAVLAKIPTDSTAHRPNGNGNGNGAYPEYNDN